MEYKQSLVFASSDVKPSYENKIIFQAIMHYYNPPEVE
jgi:hypothetical protein